MELLVRADVSLFRLINGELNCFPLDWLMPVVSDLGLFTIPLSVIAALLLILGGRKGRALLLSSVAALAISDLFASHLVREFFARPRPCWILDGTRLLVSCRDSFAFPSAHASNISACVVLFSLHYPRLRFPALAIALLVGYSRIYLGVHYPADVLAGYMLGTSAAMLIYALFLGYSEGKETETGNQANRSRITPFR